MTRNQQAFFATKADLESLLRALESKEKLQYLETGLFDSSDVQSIPSLLGVTGLGHLSIGDHNQGPCYLVASREVHIASRPVPQRRGGMKYAVDQDGNPQTIVFRPSGTFGDNFLIDGQIGTISDDPHSLALFHLFRNEIRRQFSKVREFYLGREGAELLDKGWRLTASVRSPAIYDLKRD